MQREDAESAANFKRGLKIFAGVTLAAIIGAVGVPMIQTAYSKSKAEDLIEETKKESVNLCKLVEESRNSIKGTDFLMVQGETIDLWNEVEDSDRKLSSIHQAVEESEHLFNEEKYDKIRMKLSPDYEMEEGKTRFTPKENALAEQKDLRSKVLKICNYKLKLRNEVWRGNELFLKARLKKPYTTEDEDIQYLKKHDLLHLVPKMNAALEEQLSKMSPDLKNSMGVNLGRHQQFLRHIKQYAKVDTTKEKAQTMYNEAESAYLQVRNLNDKLKIKTSEGEMWYRPELHDGKLSMAEMTEIYGKQRDVKGLIETGDNHLKNLVSLYDELHQQKFVVITGQSHERFSYTDRESYMGTDMKGNVKLKWRTVNKTGYKFFVTITTTTPAGSTSQKIQVGKRKSSSRRWNYQANEQVGWMRMWKRLHYENSHNLSGMVQDYNPRIEEECK